MLNYLKLIGLIAFTGMVQIAIAGEVNEMGNNCTTGLSKGILVPTDCKTFEIYKGKKYCFSSEASKQMFSKDPEATIKKANMFYEKQKPMKQSNMMEKDTETNREKISQADALAQINSKSCDLSNKDAGYLIFNELDLSHCNLYNVSFFGAELKGANLSGANLQKAYLNLARLENANFTGADLTDAIIFQAIFSNTNFSKANLTNARMIGTLGKVDMHEAIIKNGRFGLDVGNQPMGQMKFDSVGGNFAGANFEGADLNIAAFPFADLRGANLRNTNLYRADLAQADLTGADLTGANLTDADVDGATFTDVKGLDTVKGFDSVEGQCRDCVVSAAPAAPTKTAAVDACPMRKAQ